MDKAQLHSTTKILDILRSPELDTILSYLREHIPALSDRAVTPEYLINKGGRIEGWLECVNALRDLRNTEEPKTQAQPRGLY